MEVYVNKLPKSCRECFACYEYDWCKINENLDVSGYGANKSIKERHPDCPLRKLSNVISSKFILGQEVFYIKYSEVSQGYIIYSGLIVDILVGIEQQTKYNFKDDEYIWIFEDKVFNTKKEAEDEIKKLRNN